MCADEHKTEQQESKQNAAAADNSDVGLPGILRTSRVKRLHPAFQIIREPSRIWQVTSFKLQMPPRHGVRTSAGCTWNVPLVSRGLAEEESDKVSQLSYDGQPTQQATQISSQKVGATTAVRGSAPLPGYASSALMVDNSIRCMPDLDSWTEIM